MSQKPQKLHFAWSKSTTAFFVSSWVLGCLWVVMAALGQAKVQIWQPTQRFLSSASL